MKPIENSPSPKLTIPEDLLEDNSSYYCRFCGEADSGVGVYRETTYGDASLVNLSGELEGYEVNDSDNFEVYAYRCNACGEERDNMTTLFSSERPSEAEEEER